MKKEILNKNNAKTSAPRGAILVAKNKNTPVGAGPVSAQGITLISLIIIIIILLILVGVALNLTIGENGIFGLAQNAGKNYMNAQDKELADLEKLYSQIKIATNDGSQITLSMEDLNKFINEKVEEKLQSSKKSYGDFYTEKLLNVANNTNIPFYNKSGNIEIDDTNTKIHLQKGKHYYIHFSARYCSDKDASNYGDFVLYNITNDTEIRKAGWAGNLWMYASYSIIYTPEEDMDLILKLTSVRQLSHLTNITLNIYEI